MPRFIFVCIALLMFASASLHAQKTGRDRVLKIDAVELIDQKMEVEGKVDFQHQHDKYIYLFASAENRNAFEANPAKYEIQLGGACARMGPLSGEGSPKIFAVHDSRLYIFASEQCKQTFVASPTKFIETPESPPEADAESLRRGALVMQSLAGSAGLLRASDAPITLRQGLTRIAESGGKTYTVTHTVTLQLPDGVADRLCWDNDCWTNVADGERAWSIDSDGVEPLASVQRTALLQEVGRHPWRLAAARERPGFIAINRGERRVIEFVNEKPQECSVVTVHWEGATTSLTIDDAGRFRAMRYRGRGPDATFGEIEHIYSRFHVLAGHEVPEHVETTFNGKPVPNLSGDYVNQAVNDRADLAIFEHPKPSGP